MSQALYRKWRPQTWGEVSGQAHVTQTLQNAVAADRIGHAYLFSGPRGTGKTSVARLLAKAANCLAEDRSTRPCNQCAHCLAVNKGNFLDLIEIDAASNNGVDDVRDLRDKINFSPNQGKYKVYIIDEVHMLSTQAFNALLKTLEEPPPHAIFILATTEIHKIPATVLSRCQRHEFKRATVEDITNQLKEIAAAEKIPVDEDALTLIARQATGSFRDAISLLDQMASIGQTITLEATHAILGTAASQNVLDLVEAIHKNQPADGLNVLQAAMDAGTDTRMLARQVVEYLRALLLIKLGNTEQANLPKETLKQAKVHAAAFTSPQILHMVREFNAVAADTRGSWQPSLGLELALAGVMLEPSREKAPSILFQSASVTNTEPAQPKIDPAQSKPLQAQFKPPSESGKTVSTPDKPLQEKKAEVPAKQVVIPSEKPDTQVVKETSSEMARLAKEWKNISAALKSNRTLNALLNSCRPMEVRNGVLTLGFASDILRDKANTPEQLEIIHNTISELLGLDLQVKCAISGARQDAPTDIKQDGMVAAAIKAGGKITDIQD
jgi:DNA polymerase-3 subunit gamma/tau